MVGLLKPGPRWFRASRFVGAGGRAVPPTILLLAFLCGIGAALDLPITTRMIIVRSAAIGCLVLAWLWSGREHWLSIGAALALCVALLRTDDPLLGTGLLLAVAAITALRAPADVASRPVVAVLSVGWSVRILGTVAPSMLAPIDDIVRRSTGALHVLREQALDVGLVEGGLFATLTAAFAAFASWHRRPWWGGCTVLAILGSWPVIVNHVVAGASSGISRGQTLTSAAETAALGAIALAAVAFFGSELSVDARRVRPAVTVARWRRAAIGCAILLGAGAAASAWAPVPIPRTLAPRVLFYNSGGLDWDVPRFGRFGPFSGGMFGLLPYALERLGCSVAWSEANEPLEDALALADVLVVINCSDAWEDERESRVARWVAQGGALLVLGDHTDVFGLMDGTNRLLERYGIAFAFDSAYPLVGSSLMGKMTASPRGPRWSRPGSFAPAMGVGASLDVEAPARPLVWADRAFSDYGDRGNVVGSYLGNYRLDPGESVGSVVVVAGARYGEGVVVAFGDTSPFQNASMIGSVEHDIAPLLRWMLAAGLPVPDAPAARGAWVAIVLLSIAGTRRRWFPAAFAGFASAAVSGWLLVATHSPQVFVEPPLGRDDAVLARYHAQKFGDYATEGSNVGPLVSNLRRAGFWPRYIDTFDGDTSWADASVVALVAPRERLPRDTVDRLLHYAASGGLVLLATSAPDARGSAPLLERLGASIGKELLSATSAEDPVRFVEPYPVHADAASGAAILVAVDQRPVVVRFPVGAGNVIVIGDTRFFSSGNVEGSAGHHAGTIAFIEQILLRHGRGDVAKLQRRWRDPVSPRHAQ